MMQREFTTKTVPTIEVSIYLAGDKQLIRTKCMEYCSLYGFCVTVTPNEFIYTGGTEDGVRIGIVNYPRFPSNRQKLMFHANRLAVELAETSYQNTVLVVDPEKTIWHTRRKEDLDACTDSSMLSDLDIIPLNSLKEHDRQV